MINSALQTDMKSTTLAILIFLLATVIFSPIDTAAEEFLSSGEVAGITAGALGAYALGRHFVHIDSSRQPFYSKALPGEMKLQRFLGGRYYSGKSNFLDNGLGSGVTGFICGAALTVTNLGWPAEDGEKEGLQDLFLYSAGLLTNKGINDIFKGLVARPRPYYAMEQEINGNTRQPFRSYDMTSFYSGHTSSAFFSTTYLNLRIRSTLRREMSPEDYRNWRWFSPVLLYGWSSLVGWSRIHAYKHHFSDVLIGALAGYLFAELFYSLGDDFSKKTGDSNDAYQLIKIRFTF